MSDDRLSAFIYSTYLSVTDVDVVVRFIHLPAAYIDKSRRSLRIPDFRDIDCADWHLSRPSWSRDRG